MPLTTTVRELQTALANGTTTAEQTARASLDHIAATNGELNILLHHDAERVLQSAREIDRKREAGGPLGPLAGVPVVIKDVICTEGEPTTCGSRMLENYRPPYDAHVIERLRQADAVLIGRANMDEFAMGSSTENSAFGPSRNPVDPERSPGGSSGGSAAAVAAGYAPLSLGSDTGGSIRQPASFCGVVGMKPTYGRVSRYGLVAFASSLDQIGPFATDVHGAAALLEAIAGKDERDSTSLDHPVPSLTESVDRPLENLRVGRVELDPETAAGTDPEVLAAVDRATDLYRSLGASIEPISMPHGKYSVATYYLIAPSEASSNLARYDGIHYGYRSPNAKTLAEVYDDSRGEAFGPEVKRRIMLGTYALSAGYYDAYYKKALQVRRLIRSDYDRAFESVDVLLGPVTPTPAFRLGEIDEPLAMYLADVFTIGANLAGLPGLSLPMGTNAEGLPLGIQLLAAPLAEETLLRAARMLESQRDSGTDSVT